MLPQPYFQLAQATEIALTVAFLSLAIMLAMIH
jgi:hypothetical protein